METDSENKSFSVSHYTLRSANGISFCVTMETWIIYLM
jgi:hypothetical protein